MHLRMLCIAVCLLTASAVTAWSGENCTDCHRIRVQGAHGGLPCLSCHLDERKTLADPAAASLRARGCTGCHRGYQTLFDHAMGSRERERRFVDRSLGQADPEFFAKNCDSCHLRGCLDCHGASGHAIAKPDEDACHACHKGYYVGGDYRGMAPREDNLRYQRGRVAYGETYLKMIPDVHAEAGLSCGSCHTMRSLIEGRTSGKLCLDCHRPDPRVIEHRIAAHLERMECSACHAAWAPQEYGSFYLRMGGGDGREEFDLQDSGGEYLKSAYLKRQDAPPLGLNRAGKVSPIRPEFIVYLTDSDRFRGLGSDNRLLAAEWKAFAPHTIRRGTVTCEGCHDNPRRFLLEAPRDRIYQLRQDGMQLDSFWDQGGQRVVNGSFYPRERYRALSEQTPAYRKGYLTKWKRLIDRVDTSSPR